MCAVTDPEHFRTQLLSDEPATEDTFGGPHERLAIAITDLIRNEEGGKAIGLEGGWGAGKSTVVKLVTRKLEEDGTGNTLVAVFDAWAHQGDPLRRTFLERIIQHVQDADWINRDVWDECIEHLTKRRREETQRVIPQITRYGIAFALSLLAIPTGSALIAAGATLLAAENASTTSAVWFLGIGGFVSVLFPLLVFSAAGIHRWLRQRGKSAKEAPEDLSGGLPALVTGQSTTESRTSVTESHDPTSVEFESIFRDLCDEALKDDSRQLVLAIDNLDRVAPENALAIWATLQTFLQYSEHSRPPWFGRFWVLVPFDSDGIIRLWNNTATDQHEGAVAESFLDKTFQIRFRIPPPAISNWRGYLSAALAVALPDHSEEDFHGVYRAFALRKGMEVAKPKPRDLKLFVNEIGAVHRQWQHTNEFTLSDFAGFVLLQRDGVTETALRSGTEDDDALFAERVLGNEWRDTLAILYFNTPINQARQMLLRDPIETALSVANGDGLRDLEAAHGDGFWAVFEDTTPAGAEEWDRLEPEEFARAAKALASSELFGDSAAPQRPEMASILERVRSAAVAVDAWHPFTEETAEGLVCLCRVVGADHSLSEIILNSVGKATVQPEHEDAVGAQMSPTVWMSAAFILLEGLEGLGVISTLVVPLSAEQWLEVAPQLPIDDSNRSLWQHLDLSSTEEIDDVLSERSRPEQIDNQVVSVLELTLLTQSAEHLTRLPSELVDSVKAAGGTTAQQIASLMRALTACRSANLVDDATHEQLATGGFLLHHYHQAFAERHAEAVARCAFAYLQSIPDAREPDEVAGNSQQGHEWLHELLRSPETVPNALDEFVSIAKASGGLREISRILDMEPPEPALLNAAFRDLIESDLSAKDPRFINEHWEKIRSNLPDREDGATSDAFQEFIRGLPSSTLAGLSALVVAGEFEPEDAEFYLAILQVAPNEELSAWFAAGLRSITAATWAQSLTKSDNLVALLLELNQLSDPLSMGAAYLDGLRSHAQATVDTHDDYGIGDSLEELIALLSDGNRDLLTRRVYEILEEAAQEATPLFFKLYGSLIADGDFLLAQPHFVDRVCRPLLAGSNIPGLNWLTGVFCSDSDLLNRHSDQNAVADFLERVRNILGTADDDDESLAEAVQAIAHALDIRPADPPEPAPNDSEPETDYTEPTGATTDE